MKVETIKLPVGSITPSTADRVLMGDATIAAAGTQNFTDVAGGFYLHSISPHLNQSKPTGGNLGYKDGHVEWRKFKDMNRRTASGQDFYW